MNTFESPAVIEDSSHITLHDPIPRPAGESCRVIVIFDEKDESTAGAWPAGYFDEIRIEDPAFTRPPQGNLPPVPPLDE